MKRIPTIATMLLVPALLAGCEDDITGFEDCRDLSGNFRATDFGFRGTRNSSLVRDFDREGTRFTLALRNDRTFESRFERSGVSPLVRTGAFTATGTELGLGNRALFLGAQDNLEQRFTCESLGANRFRLRSAAPTRFDFDDDREFEDEEEGIFEGEFELF
jgi:hypothetical protein